MLLYTSSAGRLGMLVFARVKKAIFSLKTHQQEEPGEVWSNTMLSHKHLEEQCYWKPLSHLKVWTSGTSLRLWPLILWTSLAAALSIFSTRFSCSCSSWVWARSIQIWSNPNPTASVLMPSCTHTAENPLTCFSACLRRSRNRSSSRTQAGSSLWPCCLAFSNWVFSSRSTCSSWSNRACRVRDTCRSSSRSKEVRKRLSRPLTGTGG